MNDFIKYLSVALLGSLTISLIFDFFRTQAPIIFTRKKAVKEVIEALDLSSDSILYDL